MNFYLTVFFLMTMLACGVKGPLVAPDPIPGQGLPEVDGPVPASSPSPMASSSPSPTPKAPSKKKSQ